MQLALPFQTSHRLVSFTDGLDIHTTFACLYSFVRPVAGNRQAAYLVCRGAGNEMFGGIFVRLLLWMHDGRRSGLSTDPCLVEKTLLCCERSRISHIGYD